jgi:hypothetical protein
MSLWLWILCCVLNFVLVLSILYVVVIEFMSKQELSKWDNYVMESKQSPPIEFEVPERFTHVEKQQLCAAIVEPRNHKHLVRCIQNVQTVLSNTLYIYVFHGPASTERLNQAFGGNPYVILVSLKVDNMTICQYNKLLTSETFWRTFHSEYVLITQTDAILFQKSEVNIYDYIESEYDYVGAPFSLKRWNDFRNVYRNNEKWTSTNAGNGGLSLRKVQAMLDTIEQVPYLSIPFAPEDVYFSYAFNQVNFKIKLPTPDEAAQLFYEHMDTDEGIPFGAHKFVPVKWKHLIEPNELVVLRYH